MVITSLFHLFSFKLNFSQSFFSFKLNFSEKILLARISFVFHPFFQFSSLFIETPYFTGMKVHNFRLVICSSYDLNK